MADAAPVTVVEAALARRRRLFLPLATLLALIFLVGAVVVVWGVIVAVRYSGSSTPRYADAVAHFAYGSIGTESASGLPYWVWQALPRLFPEAFGGRLDYGAFGFLYENDEAGRQRDLPIGIARRTYRGVDLVWFNCAVCHVGTWREGEGTPRQMVAGMPSNNLDLGRFIAFLLAAAADERLAP
jgi:hypothetical protein